MGYGFVFLFDGYEEGLVDSLAYKSQTPDRAGLGLTFFITMPPRSWATKMSGTACTSQSAVCQKDGLILNKKVETKDIK